jgi:hypothetical protein
VARYLAALASCLLLIVGAVLIWQGRADQARAVPLPPPLSKAPGLAQPLPAPPEASARSREEKRFARADKDDDGRITSAELYEPRRKAFAKLDTNGNGSLSFEEWAAKTIDKFKGADKDRTGWLTAAEYATTAPPPPKKKARCSC